MGRVIYKKKKTKSGDSLRYNQRKAVASIARRVVDQSLEDKSALYQDDSWGYVSATGTSIFELTSVAQGDSVGERSGLCIRKKNMNLHLSLALATGVTTTNAVRVIAFMWNDDTAPTVANILHTTYPHSMRALAYLSKCGKTIFDRTYILHQYKPEISVTRFHKLGNSRTWYTSSGAGTGVKGRVYLFLLVPNSSDVWYRLQNRLRFEDA